MNDGEAKATNNVSFPDIGSKYKITSILGEGAMGTVYKAEHSILNRTVAIKVINSRLVVSSKDISRFLREAKLSARLNHPNIVQIYDIDQIRLKDQDTYFIVSEFVEGTTLKTRMEKLKPNDFNEILKIGKAIFKGLNHAHSAGIVHRDIKPENILITPEGKIKIADFGIALNVDGKQSDLTQEGTMIGTPAFMAPEQIMSSSKKGVSFLTDYYATGVILYQMVTGIPPFTGKNIAEILTKHLKEAPVRPSLHNAELPPRLERLILSILQKDPGKRPQKGDEILAEIASISSDQYPVQSEQSALTMNSGINNRLPQSALTVDGGTKATGRNPGDRHKRSRLSGQNKTVTKRDVSTSTSPTLSPGITVAQNSGNTEDNRRSEDYQKKRTRIGILLTIIVTLTSIVAFILYSHSNSDTQPAPLLISAGKKLPPVIISEPRQYVRQYTVDIDWEASGLSPNGRVNVLSVEGKVRTTTPCIPYPRYINSDSGIVTYSATYKNSYPNAKITAYISGFGDEVPVEIAKLEFENLIELNPQERPPYDEAVFRHCISKLIKDEPELFKKGESYLDSHVLKRLELVNKEYAPEFTAGPVIVDNKLYIGTNAGQIRSFVINEKEGTLGSGWTFNDTKPNYGDFCCFAVKESRINAFCLRFPYGGPVLFDSKKAKAAPDICNALTEKYKSIVSNYLSEISRTETKYPSYYSINSDRRFKETPREDYLPPQRKFKETEELLTDYEMKSKTPESLLLDLVKSFSVSEEKDSKIGWFRPYNIQSRYAPVSFDGLIFYTFTNFNPSIKARNRKGMEEKWFVKCLDPNTMKSWTFYTGEPLDCTVFNFNRKQKKVYFTDPQNIYCLNYRDRFAVVPKESSSEIISESGEYRISAEEICNTLPENMPSSQRENLMILGPPIIVSDEKMMADNSFYLFLWINSQKENINEIGSLVSNITGTLNKEAVDVLVPYRSYLAPVLVVFKVKRTSKNGKLQHELTYDSKLSYHSERSPNAFATPVTIARSRLESSLSIVEDNRLCLVLVGSELFVIKTTSKTLDSPSEAVIVHNHLSEASRIRSAAIYKNHIYFTLEDAFACFTMLNKISFSPTLLLDSPDTTTLKSN
jgi:serine/threonine protein kinase